MKKTFFTTVTALIMSVLGLHAQSWTPGSSLMYLDPPTTKLGIGTSSPNAKLHINETGGGSPFQIDINGEPKYIMDSQGLIGVGGSPFWQARFFVNGNIGTSMGNRFFVGDMFQGNNVYLGHAGENGVGILNYYPQLWIRNGNDIVGYKHSLILDINGEVGVGDYPDNSMFNVNSTLQGKYPMRVQVDRNDKFVVTYAGNVGIGITNPTQKLEVAGSAKINDNLGVGTTATNGRKLGLLQDDTNNTGTLYNLYSTLTSNNASSTGSLYGAYFSNSKSNTNSSGTVYGISSYNTNYNKTGNVYGMTSSNYNYNTTAGTVYGNYVYSSNANVNGTVYGVLLKIHP